MNKKGAELTVGTIVVIVLAVIVLVVLVLGFTGGWGNLWERVSGIFSKSNVDSVVQACETACTMQSENDFCEKKRTVVLADGTKLDPMSCHKLISRNDPRIKLKDCSIECPLDGSRRNP